MKMSMYILEYTYILIGMHIGKWNGVQTISNSFDPSSPAQHIDTSPLPKAGYFCRGAVPASIILGIISCGKLKCHVPRESSCQPWHPKSHKRGTTDQLLHLEHHGSMELLLCVER